MRDLYARHGTVSHTLFNEERPNGMARADNLLRRTDDTWHELLVAALGPEDAARATGTNRRRTPIPKPASVPRAKSTRTLAQAAARARRQVKHRMKQQSTASALTGTILDPNYRTPRYLRVAPGEMTCLVCGEVSPDNTCIHCGIYGEDGRLSAATPMVPTVSYLRPDEYVIIR